MAMTWLSRLDALPVPRPARFLLVGLSGVGVNSGALFAFVEWAGLPLLLAAALAIETSIWNNFLLNDAWTFGRGRRLRPRWTRALAFHGTAATAAAINLGRLMLLVSSAGLHYLPANLIAIAVAAGVNYSVSTLWTWRPKPFSLPPSWARGGEPLRVDAKKVVVIPTYNEEANIKPLLISVLGLGPDYQAVVVDDGSPDGTGDIVAAMAAKNPRIHLIRRPAKLGLGTAYVVGFREAMALGTDAVFQMDADFSHDPADLPRLAEALREADVAIGSRYVPGGSTVGWTAGRRLVSAAANLGCRLMLGVPIKDVTGGFKGWRRRVIEALPLERIRSTGFAFQIETNYLAWQSGFAMREVPIAFMDRRLGRSKASLGIALEMAALVLRLSLGSPQPYLVGAPRRREKWRT
jgi:dolichol-phosphate mannosyltransferase